MIVPVRNINKLPQQARCFRPIVLVTSPLARAHLRKVVAEAIVGCVAFMLWCGYCSVSFRKPLLVPSLLFCAVSVVQCPFNFLSYVIW